MVNVNPTNTRAHSETPEIRKYKKRFNSEILCAALWGKPGLGRKRGICVPLCSWSGERLALPLICPRAPIAGVNLLVGTENGLMLLDRSGQGKVYGLIGRRRFQQMDVLEGLNLLITISGVCVEDGGGTGPGGGGSAPWLSVTIFSLGRGQPWSRSRKVGPLSHPLWYAEKDGGRQDLDLQRREGVCVSSPLREKEQTARVLPVLAPEQDSAQ